MSELTTIQSIAIWILPIIFAVTVHEVAHGWVAKQYGDNTASMAGRLTLNPLKHIDLIGTIIIPGLLLIFSAGFVFGWAKPVPVDIRYFKNPKKMMAIVAVAGPVANLLMAIAWALVIRVGAAIEVEALSLPLVYMGAAGITINLVLALVNLIPIPPLDGSRILSGFLPHRWAWKYNQLERFGLIFMLILLWSGAFNYLLVPPLNSTRQLLFSLAGL